MFPIQSLGTITFNDKIYVNGNDLSTDIKPSGTILEKKEEFLEGKRDHLTLEKNGYLRLEYYNSWIDITPYPSERSHQSMVYDSTHDCVILFGGYDGQYYDDTWIYNYTDNSWTDMNPTTKPSRRSSASMVYDSNHDQVILYGGVYYDSNLEEPIICFNDIWIYTYINNSWTEMKPAISSGPRYRHCMVYDSTHDQAILFGGIYANYEINRYVYYNDTWIYTYTNNSWTNMNPTTKPSSRYSSSMVYDSTHDCIILFGGNERYQSILFGPDPDMKDDTWIYNFTDNSWTNMNPLTKPSARDGHSMVYDTKNYQVILFGGWDKNLYDNSDTWIYDYSSNSWTNMNPTTKPNAREDHSMIYDSKHECVILFGGQVGKDVDNSWWFYDYSSNVWTRAISVPIPRSRHSMAYDSTHNQVILFGGFDYNGNLNGETWIYTYSNNSWKNMNPLIRPSKREDYSMVYDSTHDHVILFGGDSYNPYSDNVMNFETWIYTYSNNSWKNMNPLTNPSARGGHSMVYDSTHDQVILFGGWYSQNKDATWIYNFTDNTWINMHPTIQPWASGGHSMIYDSKNDQVILYGGPKNLWDYSSSIWIYKISDNYFQQGIFNSRIIDFNDFYKISGEITWNPLDQPVGTSVQVQVGFSNTLYEEDFLYTALHHEFFAFQGTSKYIKYRIIFQSDFLQNNTPLLKTVNITYSLESLYSDELNIPLIVGLSVGFSLGIGMGIGVILGIFLRKKRKIYS